jgi:arylsulfatase A-like enzyme
MVHHMDEGIGRVLGALDDMGAAENTFVVFTSDNGGERFSDNWPLVGGKMDLLEGGIRVPYIARWPARVPQGRTTARLAITMDWTATFLNAAGVDPHPDYPLDGIDLLDEEKPRSLYWRMKFREQKAVRSGNWKYLSIEGNEFLFDLSRDPRERANMRFREPARLEQLRVQYATWEADLPPIPEDAKVSLVYGPAEMAKPS